VHLHLGKTAAAGLAAAALAVGLGVTAAAASPTHTPPPVHNTTIACSTYCADWDNVGDGYATGTTVTLSVRNGAPAGQTQASGAIVRQRTAVNTAWREDFTYSGPGGTGVGYVYQFLRKGWISGTSYAALHYRDDVAFELEYAPYGVSTGECVGVAKESYQGEAVTLQPCGLNANTLWIVDVDNVKYLPTSPGYGLPLINGSSRYATVPVVLTGNNSAAGGLTVAREATQLGVVDDNQLWYYGLTPAA
jgi:hypothetical protein